MNGTEIVGRDEDLDHLVELVGRQPLVTITGAPGVGKSAVARALSARLGTEDVTTLWCSVADLGRANAELDPIAAMADHFGFGSVDSLHSALDDCRHLVVIDGCELRPDSVTSVVEGLLDQRPELRIVATSRRPLGSWREYLWVLPPLALPPEGSAEPSELATNPAVRLYLERSAAAGSTHVDDQLDTVAALVRELDGLPLGIELAAARSRTLGPVELLDRIDQQLDLLRAGQGSRRSASLRAALDVAYAQLDPEEQSLLRALSVFRGSIAGDLVHQVCGGDHDEIHTADLLGGLVDASLVQAEPTPTGAMRYRLLNVVRRFAADELEAAGETDAVQEQSVTRLAELADSFVTAALEGWSDELVARMLGCFHTLVGAIELAIARDTDASRAIRLVLPLYSAVHGVHAHEVAALGSTVLARWPEGDEPLRREAIAVIAAAHLFSGDATNAGAMADAILDDPASSDLAQVLAARTAGFAAAHGGDATSALQAFDRGIAIATGLGGPFRRELEVARAAVRAAGPVDDVLIDEITSLSSECARAAEPVNQMWCLIVLGHVLVRADRLDEAASVASESIDLAVRLDHPWGRGSGRRILAVVEVLSREWSSSRPLWEATMDENVRAGDRGALAQTVDHAWRAAARVGETEVAVALADARLLGSNPTILPPMLYAPVGTPAGGGTTSMAESAHRFREVMHAEPVELAVPSPPTDSALSTLVQAGDLWTVTFDGESATVRHAKGIDDLARLLGEPGVEFHCLDLMGAGVVEPDTGPDVDDTARRRYEERIRELQDDLEDAEEVHDVGRVELVTAELDALVEHLTRATALAGRDRSSNATVERARAAVRWRMRAAIDRLADAHPALGHHLAASIRTGAWCSYQPDQHREWRIVR